MKKNFLSVRRMVTSASKCALVTLLLAAGLTACTEDRKADNGKDANLQTSELQITTDPAQMSARVINYNFGSGISRRNISGDFQMPAVPDASVYENLPEYQGWGETGPDSKITGDIYQGFMNDGQNIYLAGKWTINGTYNCNGKPNDQCNATIYVLPGATLEFTNNGFEAGAGHITIYNYGTLTFANGENQCRLGGNLTIVSASDIDQIPNLNMACECVTYGAIVVNRVHFNNAADVWINCKIEARDEVIFDNEATFHVGYIKSPVVKLMANPKVVLRDGGYIETDELYVENVQTASIYALDGDIALIKAGKTRINNAGAENLRGTFGNLNIICSEWIYGENVEATEAGLGLNASVKLNSEVDVVLEETDDACAPVIAKPETEQPEPPAPSLETISTITNDHDHPISATCIQFSGSKAYVSWHERGQGIHGCIEVVENTAEGIQLLAYAEDLNTDYNHIIVDDSRLITVGHNAKSAIIGEIALTGGSFVQGEKLRYATLKGNKVTGADDPDFYGGDGNCVVRNGKYLSVASYGGFHTLNADFTRMEPTSGAVATTGSAKHLALANGKLLALNLTERDKTAQSSPAELRIFNADDYTWSSPVTISSELIVSPIDGKNTIAFDAEGNMYVCLGFEGVKKFNGTTLVGEFNNGNPANGIAVDDKYLYLANGKELLIFAKEDLTAPILSYGHTGFMGTEASCNYVAVNGDLIWLAYGTDGVDVLRLKNR